MPRVRLVAAAALVVLATPLSACGVVPESPGSSGGTTTRPIDSVDRDELATDERTAVQITDRFWRETFPDEFGRSYRPPTIEGGYVGDDGPSCAGEPSVPFNAFYCPSEDFIAWDENLMAAGYSRIGDAWVYLIISHEWGHAVQARLERDRVSVMAELQADCLAGAALFGAARRGWVTLEPGDTDELRQTLVAVADDFPWTKQTDHGDAQQRIDAFSAGANGGVPACT
ncbi:MAG TPA: neutral zinc metallopeptidase [Mycobacteriales bacterium]